jgi:hypothetical protein
VSSLKDWSIAFCQLLIREILSGLEHFSHFSSKKYLLFLKFVFRAGVCPSQGDSDFTLTLKRQWLCRAVIFCAVRKFGFFFQHDTVNGKLTSNTKHIHIQVCPVKTYTLAYLLVEAKTQLGFRYASISTEFLFCLVSSCCFCLRP